MSLKIELERMTEACSVCDSEDEQLVIVVSRLNKPADHYCLSCACSLVSKLDKLLREVPTV